MVKPVKPVMIGLMALTACVFGNCLSAPAVAQDNLRDPTRPPASLDTPNPGMPIASSSPVLQSVLISQGRKVAVISGETVQVGDRLGDARVTKIREGEVVLVRDGQSQTLKLFPGIEKRQAKSGVSVKETGRRH